MNDYSLRAEPPAPPPPVRPSTYDSLKHAASKPAAGWVSALVMLATAVTTALKTADDAEDKTRMAYEALRAASERHDVQDEVFRKALLEQSIYIQELSRQLERKQEITEQTLRGKVQKPKAPPAPVALVEPAPKAPPPPAPLEPTDLPPFDGLELRAQEP